MAIVKFNCVKCNKENTTTVSKLVDITNFGRQGVSSNSNFGGLGGGLMGGLGGLRSSSSLPKTLVVNCIECNAKNKVSF